MTQEADGIHARLVLERANFSLNVDLRLPSNGVTVLFGPSGCGKTTCLRAMAGLERAQGSVQVNGETWQDDVTRTWLPTHQRALGYVFQETSLFDHLNVRRNMEYGLKRLLPQRRRVSLEQAVELLGLAALLERTPQTLSGGERQRVAIARALATSPGVLLMDEPLAALDAARKAEVLPYLERLQRELSIPIVYITHSSDEVARLATHLVLLQAGRVIAQGMPQELMARLDLPMAAGDTAAALVHGQVTAWDATDQLLTVAFPGGDMHLATAKERPIGENVRLRVLARDVSLARTPPQDSSVLNVLPARITEITADAPGQVMVRLDLAGTPLMARITQRSRRDLSLLVGEHVFVQVKGVALAS